MTNFHSRIHRHHHFHLNHHHSHAQLCSTTLKLGPAIPNSTAISGTNPYGIHITDGNSAHCQLMAAFTDSIARNIIDIGEGLVEKTKKQKKCHTGTVRACVDENTMAYNRDKIEHTHMLSSSVSMHGWMHLLLLLSRQRACTISQSDSCMNYALFTITLYFAIIFKPLLTGASAVAVDEW